MIIFSYGITKSGSTLLFELTKVILNNSGYKQRKLPDTVVESGHKINFINIVTIESINKLLKEVRDDEIIVVKTHSFLDFDTQIYLEYLALSRKIKIHASYRNPFDISLSMIDHGNRSRIEGHREFSNFHKVEDTLIAIKQSLSSFRKWSSISGSLRFEYEDVAFDTDKAFDMLIRDLAINIDNVNKESIYDEVFNRSFTQKNKAIKKRYLKEMTDADIELISNKFKDYLYSMYEGSIKEDWFNDCRLNLLEKMNIIKRNDFLSNLIDIEDFPIISIEFIDKIKSKFISNEKLSKMCQSRNIKYNNYDDFTNKKYAILLGDINSILSQPDLYKKINATIDPISVFFGSNKEYTIDILMSNKNYLNLKIVDLSEYYLKKLASGYTDEKIKELIKNRMNLSSKMDIQGS
jgi:hypothetical protein